MYEKGLIRKLKLISKITVSQTGRYIITIHVLSKILIIKDNQTVECGQLEFYVRSIFLQKSYRK